MLDKELLFKEFYEEKEKDLKLSTDKKEVFKNRLEYLKQHADAKRSHPKLYSNLDVDFDKFVQMYSSENPRDYYYKSVFGKTYSEYMYDKQIEEQKDEPEEKYYPVN